MIALDSCTSYRFSMDGSILFFLECTEFLLQFNLRPVRTDAGGGIGAGEERDDRG